MVGGEAFVWRGRTRNPHNVPAADVKIYIDYFDELGFQYGSVPPGKLDDVRTLGPGKSAWYRARSEDHQVGQATIFVARAVGRRQ